MKKKRKVYKKVGESIASSDKWTIHHGKLVGSGKGDIPHNHLFHVIAEKIPIELLRKVEKHHRMLEYPTRGVYICHDSMGSPRYAGRGENVFGRIGTRYSKHADELVYFSYYIVEEKIHEREIETLVIRAAGFNLEFNERKKRVGISPGSIQDYEAGTAFFIRQRKKGRKKGS